MIRIPASIGRLVIALFLVIPPATAGEPFHYPEATHGKGSLKYVNGLPVAVIEGTPTEIGEQMAVLMAKPAARLLDYPKDFLKAAHRESNWPVLVWTARGMFANFPADYKTELDAALKLSGLDRDLLLVGNTMFDIKKLGGCSALVVDAAHSATKGLLFGRNLDFPTLDYLQEFSLVVIARPKGKHAFVSIGFPGLIGCLTGMNDAGLTLGVQEVFHSKDGAPLFNPQGTPYALSFRRILEECTTVAQAEKLLRSMQRTTMNNLTIADPKGGAVFEITPKSLVVRRPEEGICASTNHFRTNELSVWKQCERYAELVKCRDCQAVDLTMVAARLHAANQDKMTLQTMIFEPSKLKLHLAIGKCPSSALPMKELDLAPYFTRN